MQEKKKKRETRGRNKERDENHPPPPPLALNKVVSPAAPLPCFLGRLSSRGRGPRLLKKKRGSSSRRGNHRLEATPEAREAFFFFLCPFFCCCCSPRACFSLRRPCFAKTTQTNKKTASSSAICRSSRPNFRLRVPFRSIGPVECVPRRVSGGGRARKTGNWAAGEEEEAPLRIISIIVVLHWTR